MRCSCGTENPSNARYCRHCGKATELAKDYLYHALNGPLAVFGWMTHDQLDVARKLVARLESRFPTEDYSI